MESRPMKVNEIFPDMELPDHEINFFNDNIVHLSLYESDYFLTKDSVCRQIAFVDSGMLTATIHYDGHDYRLARYSVNQFVSAYTSLFSQEKSDWSIQATEPTHLTAMPVKLITDLCLRHNCWICFWLRVFNNQVREIEDSILKLA
jgi:hypothetical protein